MRWKAGALRAVLFLLIIMGACKKTSTFTGPKIYQTTNFLQGAAVYTYTYNTDGTISKITNNAGQESLFTYSGSTVTETDINGVGFTQDVIVYTTNSTGYADTAYGEYLKSGFSASYSYDNNGYPSETKIYSSHTLDTTYDYTIGNKNAIELNSTVNTNGTHKYDYYNYLTSNSNTTGTQDMGLYHLGVQNNNLILNDIVINNNLDTVDIISYRYRYDSNGNVDTMVAYNRAGRLLDSISYTYY